MLVAVVAVHVVMILRHMIRIRILEIRKGRRVSRPEGLASWQRGCRGIEAHAFISYW